jgi:glycine amidinotransferase
MIDYKVNVYNDWGRLKSIIVGNPLFINDINNNFYKSKLLEIKIFRDIFKYYNEIEEDRENFINILKQFSIEVFEIEKYSIKELLKKKIIFNIIQDYTDVLSAPRDTLLSIGDTIIEFNSNRDNRFLITKFAHKILIELLNRNSKWISMPIYCNNIDLDFLDELKFKNEDYLNNLIFKDNLNIMTESATMLRCGKDIFINTTTKSSINAYKWLSVNFDQFNFHPMALSKYHIDGTISLIKPGLMLLNYAWKDNLQYLPIQFKNWDKIFSDQHNDIINLNNNSLDYGTTDINVLVLDDKHIIILDYMYEDLSTKFKKYNIECIPVRLRYENCWHGGPHCITTEIYREGNLENYF